MPLFNKKTIEQALTVQEIPAAHFAILQNWQGIIERKELHKQKETAVSISFVSKFIETILGYQTLGSGKNYSLAQEYPIAKGAVDTALGEFFNDKQGDKIHAVFELKGAKTKNLDTTIINKRLETPVTQGWRYARDAEGCQWILVTNYLEIRLYAYNETTLVYETFDLAILTDPTEYAKFVLCLHADNLLTGKTKALLAQSKQVEKDITEKLYLDYKTLREVLITRLIEDNPEFEPLDLISPAQKLLDRVLFVAFCEDKGLLDSKCIEKAVKHVDIYNPNHPIYQNFKGLFQAINKGNAFLNVNAYNGGLFSTDKLLDKLIVADELCKGFLKIAEYDFASEISVTVLGHIFEQSIADLEEITAQIQADGVFKTSAKTTSVSGKRKQHGIVYTPDHITAFIVEHTLGEHLKQRFADCLTPFGSVKDDGEIQWKESVKKESKKEKTPEQIEKELKKVEEERTKIELAFWYAWQTTLKTIKIVDPACGSGAFLVAAFDVLHFEYQKANNRIAEITEHGDIFDLNKEILNSNLFGVDLNSESVEITKLSLWLKTAERGKKLTTIDKYIQVGNSLGFDSPTFEGGFCWQNNFSKIMKSGGFDVVLGNPPYVKMEFLTPIKSYLTENYIVASDRADLYAYFFELGFKLLKSNGMLGFISNATFFKTGSGEPLRRYLKDNATLKKVVDFGDLQVFEGVTTYPAILIFQNAKPIENSQIQMLALTKKLPEKLGEYFALNRGVMAYSQLKNESWQFEDARLSQLRDKLTHGFQSLKEIYGAPCMGLQTGLNEAFVIDGETKKRLISQNPNSAELLKPFLEGKDLKKWHSQPRDMWIIYIPKNRIKIDDYPAIRDYLMQFKEKLENRATKQEWFELKQAQENYTTHFENSKIAYCRFMPHPLFHLDTQNYYPNDAIYFIPKTGYYELGLLNSKLLWFLLISDALTMSGGFYQVLGHMLEKLPIPPATPEQKTKIGELAQRCQTLTEARYKLENDTRLTIAELGVKKLTQKLEKWWALEFQGLLDELKKSAKVEIELKKQREWREFFNDAKLERDSVDLEIRLLEKELNELVYGLFGLDDEEVGMIEGGK